MTFHNSTAIALIVVVIFVIMAYVSDRRRK